MQTKLSILKTCVFSTMLYGCETWTVTKRCESRILSFERKCYRKILRIEWTQKVTNEELYRKIQLTETLLQKVIQRKLRLFGHICRMNDSRKIKILVFGMMDGSNKRGRPHREWSDDIEQWCGTTLQELRPKVGSDSKNGVRHQRALSPRLSMMMMNRDTVQIFKLITIFCQLFTNCRSNVTKTKYFHWLHIQFNKYYFCASKCKISCFYH